MDRDGKLFLIEAKTGHFKVIDQAPFTGSYDSISADYSFSPISLLFGLNE